MWPGVDVPDVAKVVRESRRPEGRTPWSVQSTCTWRPGTTSAEKCGKWCFALQLQHLGSDFNSLCVFSVFRTSQKLLSVSFHDTRVAWSALKWPWHIMRGIYMVVVNTLPGLCTLIPTLVAGPPDSFNILQHSIWASREIMNWLFAGVVVLYALRLSMRGWLIAVTLLPHCPRHNRVICSILMPVLMSVMLLGPAYGLHCLFFAFWTDNKKVNKKSVSHVFANWSFFQGQK